MAKEETKKNNTSIMNIAFEKALLELLKYQPFEKISLSQLVNKAGYSRGTFYNYYEDIYDFLNVMINNKINLFYENEDLFSADSEIKQISTYTKALAQFIDNNRDFFCAVSSDDIVRTQFLALYAGNVDCRRKSIPRHSLPSDLPDSCIPAFRLFWHAGVLEINKALMLSSSPKETKAIIECMEFIASKLFK